MQNLRLIVFGIFGSINLATCAQAQTSQSHDWSGYYLGGNLGTAHGRAATHASTADDFSGSYFTSPDAEQIAEVTNNTISQNNPALGLSGGYGKQFDRFYLGIEASINSLNFDKTATSSAVYQSNAAASFTQQMSVKSDWQATLRTRLGVIQDRWMAYVTGGLAATQIKLNTTFSDNFLGAGAYGHNSNKETKLGWVAGVGGEYALSDKWTLRAEYLYTDYGTLDTNANVHNPAFSTLNNALKSSVDFKTQIFSVGLSYHF